jgi:hypothetical protein
MRRFALTALFALSLVLISSAPALAGGGNGGGGYGGGGSGKYGGQETLTVWCTPDNGAGINISGTFTVPTGHHGAEVLFLEGTKGKFWSFAGLWTTIWTVNGQTSYGFTFDAKTNPANFTAYRVVDNDGDAKSRTISRDECGFRVPEAPASGLLLLGAIPVVGIVGMRVAGVKLPRPTWTRIA